MLAVLCSAPRPPLGVALLGLLVTAISSTLRLLPYIVFCSIIILSIWVPSRPTNSEVMYYPVDGHPQHVHVAYASNVTPPTDGNGTFELNACLRVFLFLLSIPVTSLLENLLFRPARDLFLQSVEDWYDMRYVQPVLSTGSWPDTWTPILNAFRSFQFVADFVDGVMESNYSPSLPSEREARRAGMQASTPGCDIGECGGISPRTRPAVQKASLLCGTVHRKYQRKPDRKHAPCHYPVIQSEAEDSSDIPLPRKTFISHPCALSSPPRNRDSGTSLPMSKDFSRMIGVFFRHPSSIKAIPRPRFNIETRALSSSAINVSFEHPCYSTPLAPISTPRASNCVSVISRPDFTKAAERVEQIQSIQSSDNVKLPFVPQRPEPQLLMRPWLSASALQEERPIQQQYTQFPAFHAAPYQEEHIPVFEPQLTVSAPSNVSELLIDCPQPRVAMAFEQQQQSEHMDIDLDYRPPSLVHGLEQKQHASTLESAVHACSPFGLPQGHFADASRSQFSNAVLGISSLGRSFSYGPPVLQYTSALPVADLQEGFSLPSPQCMPPRKPFPPGPCALKWTTHPPPATITYVSQPHIIRPQGINATETFAFNIYPDTATPHFDFSRQAAPATPTYSGHTECMSAGDVLLDENHVSQPVGAPMQLINQNDRRPPTRPASSSDHRPEAVPRPSPHVDSVKVKVDDNSSGSDSDSSDSDYTESSSEDDSDSDGSGSSEDDEEGASAAIAGPSKVDKGKGKAP